MNINFIVMLLILLYQNYYNNTTLLIITYMVFNENLISLIVIFMLWNSYNFTIVHNFLIIFLLYNLIFFLKSNLLNIYNFENISKLFFNNNYDYSINSYSIILNYIEIAKTNLINNSYVLNN